MKSLLILTLAGLARSYQPHHQYFSSGQEYVYDYSGRILTGMPQIDSTFAGMSMEGEVIVQATSQNSFKMMMRNVKFGTFNDHLSGSSQQPTNWRNVQVESSTPLSSQYQQYMESPVEFTVEQGQFSTVKVNSEEPQWAVNFKKALVASIKVQQPQESSQGEDRRNPRFWYVAQQQDSQEQYYWTTMEEGIEGKCENTYHVSELPEYMVTEYESGMLRPELCQGKKYYQVVRTKDMTKCQDRSIYLSSQGHKNCLIGNCEAVNTKQSQTRYYGCGETAHSMELHGMISEGELQHNVLAFNTETVVTGTKQILKLKEIKTSPSNIPDVSSPKTSHDLSYEFPQSHGQSRLISSRQDQREFIKELSKNPETQTFVPLAPVDNIDFEKLKTEMVEKIQEIAPEMSQSEQFAEKEIPSKLKSLKTILSVMKTQDLQQMYKRLQSSTSSQEQKDTARTLYIEIVRNAGTSPCVIFLKQMIEQDQMTEIEKFLVVSTFSHYIKTPPEDLIHQNFQLIKSSAIPSKPYLKAPAQLVFATLVRQACLYSKNKVYPENVFGKMCSPTNQKITEEYIPYLVQQLRSSQSQTEKQAAIYTLGQLGHESVLPLIISYIEGKDQTNTSVRKVALYSLADVAQFYGQQLLPVYLSVFQNPGESRSLRITALKNIFMKLQPTTSQLQKMAVSTWFEQDHEVARYVYSSLKSYAQLQPGDHPEDSSLRQLSEQCQSVLKLAKPMSQIISVHQVHSGYLPELQIGATMVNSLLKGMTSTEIYHKTEYYLKQAQTVPMEFAGHVAGLNTVFKSMKSLGKHQGINQELKKILSQLEVSPRTDSQFEAGAWLRLSDDINFAVEFNEGHISVMKEKVLKAIKESGFSVMQKVCGKHSINHNNVFEELPYQALVPSDMGLPIIVESQMTYLVSLKGEVNLECSFSQPSAQLELSKKLSYTYNGYAGTFCPFTKEMLAAGINIHRATNIPVTTKVELQPQTSKLVVSMSPSSQVSSQNSKIDVHHYHVKPFTTKKSLVFEDMTPMVLHPNTKIVRSRASPKTFQASFGESVGVDMNLKVETECDVYDKKTMMDSWSNYHYNPMVASWFSFTETALTSSGQPTARLHKYTLTHNPAQSSTKKAEIEVELSAATRQENQQTKKIKLSSQQAESSEHDRKLETCLNKLNSKQGYAFNAQVNCKLTGSQTQDFSYSITAGAGNNNLEHKWNMDLHLQNQNQKVCVEGYMKYPTSYNSQSKFQYNNRVGFGQTCQQYYVNIDGHTEVSEQQRQQSYSSWDSQKCQFYTEEEERLRQQMKYNNQEEEEEEYRQLEKQHTETARQKLEYCSKKVEQSKSLDYTQFDVTYSSQLPHEVYSWAKRTNMGVKAALYQYISYIGEETNQNKITVKLNINQELNSLSMTVASPEDTTRYTNIRLPYQLSGMIPLVAGKNPAEQGYKALTGQSLMSQCVMGEGYVQTFDQKTYSYQLDECDHVVASDCSGDSDHAVMVLAKEVNGMKHITILSGQTKIQLSPAQAYSNNVEEYQLSVNGQEVSLQQNQEVTLSSQEQITAYYSEDQTVTISTPSSRITHSGKTVQIEEKGSADGSHY